MPSPFPGMDPYLEGYLWPDVHNALANKMRQLLSPLLRPRYTARLGIYVVEDSAPESDIGIMYPDVEVMQRNDYETTPRVNPSTTSALHTGTATPALLSIPVILPVEVQIPVVEIRDAAHNQLVTSIEILSPVNKREPGLAAYRQKRQRLYQAGIHLIEIDLLRRGSRPISDTRVPVVPYLVMLTRAHAGRTQVWPLALADTLPTIPVPLRQPDDDVLLDLSDTLQRVYDEAAYDLSIDYRSNPPPPVFQPVDQKWMRELLDQP